MNRNASRIARTKSFSQKDSKFLALGSIDQQELIESFILSLPAGAYMLRTEGRAARALNSIRKAWDVRHAVGSRKRNPFPWPVCEIPQKDPPFTHGLDVIYLQ